MTPTIREPSGPVACPRPVLTGRIGGMANNEVPTGGPLRLTGTFGSTKRSGEWHVPAHVVLRRRMGSAELDFTAAVLDTEHTRLEVDMIGGSVELRVPDDMHVESSLSTTFASYEDHRQHNPSSSGRSLTISGRAVWGSVEVGGPAQPGWARRKK
jgi:hypothetical protein